jgi:hypothetical protein
MKKDLHGNAHSAQNRLGFSQYPKAEILEQAKGDLLTF